MSRFYKIIFSSIIIIPTFLFVYNHFSNKNTESLPEIVTFEGKTDGFNSLEELENETQIIISGTKIEEIDTKISKSLVTGTINNGFTKSNFKIDKVFKNGNNDDQIIQGNNITISEIAFYDKKTHTMYNINNYEKMTIGEKYLLFLIPVDNGMFSTRGVTFGKISLENKNEKALKNTSEDPVMDTIFNDAREKYKDW